jgi:DNA-binding MarR family transcriptional regulator
MTPSELRIYHRLQMAAHRLQKAADRRVMAAAGVTTAQAAVLAIVKGQEGATQRSIARQLGLNESAMTAMVGRLSTLGLLVRTRDPVDGRTWNLELTAQGEAALAALGPAFGQINARISDALDPAALLTLSDALTRLTDAFDDA